MKTKLLVTFILSFCLVTFFGSSNVTANKSTCTQCFTVSYQGQITSNAVVTIYDMSGNRVAECTTANNPPQCCLDLTEGNYIAKAVWWQGVSEFRGQASFTACNTPIVNIDVK